MLTDVQPNDRSLRSLARVFRFRVVASHNVPQSKLRGRPVINDIRGRDACSFRFPEGMYGALVYARVEWLLHILLLYKGKMMRTIMMITIKDIFCKLIYVKIVTKLFRLKS